MSGRRATGMAGKAPVDPIAGRVAAALELAERQGQTLTEVIETTPPEQLGAVLAPIVADLLRTVAGLQAVIMPMAAHMDMLLGWQGELEIWRAEMTGRLLFSAPRLDQRA